jgi:hypothetical protein
MAIARQTKTQRNRSSKNMGNGIVCLPFFSGWRRESPATAEE